MMHTPVLLASAASGMVSDSIRYITLYIVLRVGYGAKGSSLEETLGRNPWLIG